MIQTICPSVGDSVPANVTPYIDVHGVLDSCLRLICPEDGEAPSNVLLNSAHGMGKSLLVANLAHAAAKRIGKPVPMIVLDCSEDTRDYHLRGGSRQMPDGSTAFVLGTFPAAIELANQAGLCILDAEEISALTPGAQKMFNAMTDWRRSVYIPEIGKKFSLSAGAQVVVVGTMNPSAYGGVFSLNADLRSRFNEFNMPTPDMKQEGKILKSVCPWASAGDIEKACMLARETRTQATEYKVSTRDLEQLLRNMRRLGNPALVLGLLANKFEEGPERNVIVDRINAVYGVRVSA
jgi:MoxR-like ATPase